MFADLCMIADNLYSCLVKGRYTGQYISIAEEIISCICFPIRVYSIISIVINVFHRAVTFELDYS